MLRGVRDRLGRRRGRRQQLNDHAATAQRVGDASGGATGHSAPPQTGNQGKVEETLSTHDTSASDNFHPAKRVQSHKVMSTTEEGKQPKVFRNRSVDYRRANGRDVRILGIIPAKALRPFQRGKGVVEKVVPRDRPLEQDSVQEKTGEGNGDSFQRRNDDSFSSLPSTHASRDPFLNDDVPVEISRVEGREDRPRQNGVRREADGDAFVRNVVSPFPLDSGRSSGEGNSPPQSFSSSSTFRRRNSLWRMYDPDNECQSAHERQIHRAIELSEAAVKEKSVTAARQLAKIVNQQVMELDVVLGDIGKSIENARVVAQQLPSSSDPRFQALLYSSNHALSQDAASGKAEAERVFRELQWTERVWDIEAMAAEKRYEECVSSIEKLEDDGFSTSASPRTQSKYKSIVQQLVSEMSACCAQGGADIACIFAPLLARVGMGDHARSVVLNSAEAELAAELQALTGYGSELTPRTVSMILDRTLGIFQRTYTVYSKIASSEAQGTSFFVAWVVEQSDVVYQKFVSPLLTKMRRADPVTILAAVDAARHRKGEYERISQKHGESLAALLETRITTHLRKELDSPVRETERQLIERARMYASAIPRNWREGPYQSGKAICDELNLLTRALEGATMNLGADSDILTGTLLVRLALEYCTTLLEMGSKAATEDNQLTSSAVQEGMFETFSIIGKAMLRIHQKYPRIPLLERVATVLATPNIADMKTLQAEMTARKSPPTTASETPEQLEERSLQIKEFLFPPLVDNVIVEEQALVTETAA